jgi:hypothetical protein
MNKQQLDQLEIQLESVVGLLLKMKWYRRLPDLAPVFILIEHLKDEVNDEQTKDV